MKYNKVFRILALAIILSLLMLVIPAAPALALDYDIELAPEEGEIGDTIDIDGTDWPESVEDTTDVPSYVDIYFSSQEAGIGDDIDDEVTTYQRVKTGVVVGTDGDFSTSFNVPTRLSTGTDDEDVHGGTYYVYVTTYKTTVSKDIRAFAEFTVIAAEITLDTDEGPVGTEVEITGVDFAGREDITVEYDGEDITDDIVTGADKTDSNGDFETTILIPESIAGDHTIKVTDESDNEAEAVFTVEPEITINPTSGTAGESTTTSGTGFGKSKDVTITFDGEEVATEETDTYGSFEATFNVPSVGPGTYDVTAEDGSNNEASARFTISTNISISPVTSEASPGHVGSGITISGTGFKANSDITITYTSEPVVFHTPSGADGSFTYTLTVPPSGAGAHTITASDGTSSMEVTFFMESTSPPIPPPLLPLMGDKAKSLAYFDWEDVKDDSMPVTYTLQIASDANFTTILLEKTGLTTSEYTLTEAEKLESTKKEAPYYWRLRAVDAASNASGWTTPGTFYVGFAFGFPELKGWVLYGLIGAGVLLVFFLGLWVGRRRGGGSEY
jgi:hypothetical protein